MHNFTQLIEVVDLKQIDDAIFTRKSACCLVLTQDRKILLQMRAKNRKSFPDCISTFGGGLEADEAPMQALIRELHEELGARVNESEVICFGPITEAVTNYSELTYTFFWHDHLGTITGCYEDSPIYFDNLNSIINHPKSMDYVIWLSHKCRDILDNLLEK